MVGRVSSSGGVEGTPKKYPASPPPQKEKEGKERERWREVVGGRGARIFLRCGAGDQ